MTGAKASPLHERLHVAWNAPAGQTISGYVVQWKSGTQEYASTRQKAVTSGTAASIAGLTNDTVYTVRVRAYNGTGDGAWSDDAGWKDGSAPDGGGPCCAPQAPTLRAKSVEADSATLELDGYVGDWHYKHTTPGSGSCSTAVTAGSTGLSTASLSNLDKGASYAYKAYSDSSCSSDKELAQAALLTKPGQVTGVALTPYTDQLDVSWTALGNQTVTSYKVQWKSDQEGEKTYDTSRQNTATGTTSSITGLVNGRTYTVRVIAYNGTGDGEPSSEATGQPKAVTLTSSNVEAATATLTIAYHVGSWYYKRTVPESGSCSESAVTGTSVNLTGLNGNTNHVYKAYSSSGCASDAELATAPTFLTKPSKPTKPTAEAGSGSGKLTVTASVTGSGTLSKWQYKQKEGTGNFDTDWTDVSSTSTSLSHVLTGLTDGTDYQYKVRARNASGFGAESDPSAAARPLDETLTASSVEATTATLTLGNYTGNWYYQYTSPSDGTCSSNAVTTSAADLANLSSNTSYTYKAYSDSGCSSNKELAAASAFLTKPGKPTKPTATAGTGSGQLTLAASVTGSGTLAKWQYKQKEGTDDFDDDWTDIDSIQTSLSHTLSGLTDSTDYQYKVRARNATGEGAESDASTAARPLDETLSASSVETTTATLTLGNYAGDWYYKYTAPTGGTCAASAVTASTKDLTELAGNTTYTFKAYSDSGCATELASETFLTKPGKPTRPTATPGAGSGKLTLKASITGDSTPAKWQYKEKEGNDWDADWTDVSNSASTSLSHTLSGLTDGTKYRYKVRAANATGDGVESDESAEATPADEALTASSVEAAAATLTLDNYAGNWWLKRTTPADAACKSKGTTYTEDLSSLSSNTSHTYKAYSDSSCTTELASETFLTKPGKPAKPVASPGAGSGKLTLTASVSGSGTLEKWQYKQKEGTGNFDADWTDVSSTSASLSHVVSGLTDGTDYQYKVRAKNASGFGAESDPSTAAQPLDETLTVSAVTATGATLTLANWNSSWWLKRTAPADTTCKSKGTTYTEDLSSLSSNSSYTYKAYSNSGCTTELAARTFLTKPGKPTKPTATAGAGSGKLTLTASVSGSGTLTRWQYKQKKGTGDFDNDWTDIQSTSISLSHTITGLTDGTDYQYKVRAANATGDGADSDASTAAQPADETLTASSVEATTATLTIGNYTGNWWLKRTTPADTTCKSKSTTATEDLTTLSSNTSYTYKAYSDSTCTTELATRTFLTKPGKPAKPTATAGSGSGKLTITSSVTGDGTLTRWQYKQKEGTGDFDDDWTNISSTSTSLSHTITGLTDGTDYQYKVQAVNATGEGAESEASTAAQPADETLTVSSITATGATLTIGNYTGSWYYKYTAPTGGTCSSAAVTQTSATVSDLDSNTAYTFKAYSDSTCATELATAAAFPTLPPKPAKPTATAGAGSGKLTITSSVTGSSALSKWQYKQKKGTGNYDTEWTDVSSTSTSLSHIITGLDDGTDYQYKVRAVNASGDGADSDASTAAQPLDETLTASSVEATTATLTLGNYSGEWYYKYTSPSSGSCSSSAMTGSTASLTDLSPNTSYTYKAYSDNGCTTANLLASASAFLTKPGKPTKPTATAGAGSGKLTLTSSVTGDGTLSKWQYKQKEGTGNFDADWTDISSTTTSLSYTVSSLTDGTDYQYKVRAKNATGYGAESNASSAAQPAAVALTASPVEAITATLTLTSWNGSWWLKRTTPADTTCKSKGTTYTESLSSLDSNSSYTYKAYSDSTCATELGDETFLTKPGKPTRPTATAGSGSGQLALAASVSGSGTLTKWQYKQKKGTGNFDANWTDISSTTTSLSHGITGLTDGINYQYKVRAKNASGFGAESDASTAAQPLDETLTVSNIETETATLTIANWGKKGWHYKANAAPDTTCKSAGTDRAKSLTGLQTATAYVYAAYEDSNCSSSKLLATADSFTTKPGKTTGLTLVPYSQELAVSWTARSGTVTGYKVQWKSGTQEYASTRQKTITSGTQTTITNLTNNTEYAVRVTAYNGTGDGAPSDEAKSTPKAVTLAASALEDTTATLTIAYHPDAWYYKQHTPSANTCQGPVAKGTKTASLTNLTPAASHVYKAYSDSGCTAGKLLATTPGFLTKPGQATGVALTPYTGQLDVSWNVHPGTISGYRVEWKSGDENWSSNRRRDVTSGTAASITGLRNNVTYTVRVTAYNGTGSGTPSDTASAMPKAAALKAKGVEATTATLEITYHRGKWWHAPFKKQGPANCTAVTGSESDLTNLTPATRYGYMAYTTDQCHPRNRLPVGAQFLTKPGKVAWLKIKPLVDGLEARWRAVGGILSGYKVQWKSGNEDWDESRQRTTKDLLTDTIPELEKATLYTVRVLAYNDTGNGASSPEWSGSILGAAALGTINIRATAAELVLTGWNKNWHYKSGTSPHTDCSDAVTGLNAVALTGLITNTDYVYKAYEDSSCSTSELLATAPSFPTLPGKPTQPTATAGGGSGQLVLAAGVSGMATITKWQYKQKKGDEDWDDDWTDVSSTSTALTHTLTGLTDGTEYRYKARAFNASGAGETSDESAVEETASPPKGIPTEEELEASDVTAASATLTLSSYNGSWWLKRTAPADATCKSKGTAYTESLSSLGSNSNYTYKAYSDSSCSTELASETFLTKPGKPAKPVATAGAGSGKLTLASSIDTGNGAVKKWQYQQKRQQEGGGNWGDWQDVTSTSTSLSHVVSGLADEARYQFKVRAENATGFGAESDASDIDATSNPPKGVPKDETLAVSAITATSATLTLGYYTGDWHYKHTTPSNGDCSASAVTETTATVSDLSSNTNYVFKAYSDSGCSTELAAASAFPTLPPKPSKPTAAAGAGSGKLTLTATVTGGSAALTGWEYRQKKGNGNYSDWQEVNQTAKSLDYTITGLTDGASYRFKVRAKNASGEGAASDESDVDAGGNPPKGVPQDEALKASNVEAASATLTLSGHAGAWWLKRTTPADTTCKSKGTTYIESLSSLDSNTDYAYKAYSDSSCSTELAAGTFLTKPGKPAKPTAAAGAGSGKLTLTSSVTGDGALTGWKYLQKVKGTDWGSDWTSVSKTSKSLSHEITGLTDGTQYAFKVKALNATGESVESEESQTTNEGNNGIPRDETLGVLNLEATTLTLTIGNWNRDWYYKYTAPGGGSCSSKIAAGTITASVSSLTTNVSHAFKAYSNAGCSEHLASASPALTKPGKPATPQVTTRIGSGKLKVTASVTGDGTLTQWEYKQKKGTDGWDNDWTAISSTGTSLAITLSGLTDGTDYRYKVRAKNATGYGAESDASSPAQPAAVALTASPVEAASATLTLTSWNGSWWLKRTTPADTACKSKSTTTTEDLTSLSSNTNYVYKAYSDSSCATELASETFLTKPGKPTRPTATAGSGSGQLSLAASVSGSGTLTKWQYKQKKDNGSYGSWQDVSSASTTLSHVVSGLTDGARYQFKVRAWNATGAGAESDASKIDATGDPPKGVPKDETLTVSAITATGATLTLGYYTGDWHYKKTTPSSNACSDAVTGASDSVTGLTANTDHVFKAYSDAACDTELAVSRTFPTLPPKPSRPAATGGAGSGKLTLTSSVTGSAALIKWEYQHKKAADSAWGNWKEVTTTDTSLNYTASGFTDGTAYAFRVRATNASGTGAISDASATDGGKGTPRAITLAASKVEAESATLTLENWTGDWWLKRTAPASTACTSKSTTYTEDLSGLDTNASHTYGAYSESGCSTRLAEETFLTKPGKPAKPAATPGAGSGKLTLISSVTGSGALVKWQYKQKKGTEDWDDDWTDVASTSASLHHVISGLTDDTDYRYKTRAVNATGESEESDASDASQPGERTLNASDVEATTATLTLGNHTGDWWLKRTTPASSACTSKGAAYTENLQDLPSNTHHAYGAYDASACEVSIAVAVFLTKPGKPTRPDVSNGNGSGKLAVSASVSGQGRLTKWQYKKKAENAAWDADWTDADATQTTLNHTVENLADGTRYQFKVRAWNATGAGEESEPSILDDDAMPLDEVLSISAITTEGATLTLSNYAGSWRHKRTTPAGGACSALAFETPDTAVSGLAANTLHAYAAYADAACDTELAVSRTFPTLPPKPAKPEARSGAGSGKLTLTSHIKGGNAALAKWQVRQQEENDDWGEWQDVRQTAFSLVHLAEGLTDGKRYRFRVRAWNASGPGPASDPSDVSEQSRLGIPRDERLTVSGIAADSAVLTLHDYEGNWHWRRLRPAGGACSEKAEQSPETTPSGLQANTVHVFAAYPDAACKTELAASRAFPTLPPKPAKPRTLADQDPYGLTLRASVSGSAPLRHWEIARQKEGQADWEPWEKVEQTGNALDYRAKGFKTLDRTWRFRVRAANASGTGEASDPSDWITLPPDRSARPVFRDEDGNDLSVPNQHYVQHRPIDPLQLPEAGGGDGPLTYRLTPDPPDGLVFDPLARTLSGTPLEALAKTLYAYIARDEDKDETRLTFHITVDANSVPRFLEEARDQDLVQHREIEPYMLPEAEGGDPPLAYALEPALPHGLVLDEDTRTISGTPGVPWEETTYLWTVTDEDGDRARTPFVLTVRQNRVPAFARGVEDRTWTQDSPVEPLVLPEAEGGDGPLAYALTPALPHGLTLDAKSHTLTGTPAEPSPKTRYTWTASERDEDDPDQVSLAFHLTVKEDLKPYFNDLTRIPDQAYVRHRAIRPLQLPRAEGGNPPLAYTLEPPELPRGLTFDAGSRTLSGAPAELWEEAVYSYRAQDEDGDRTEPLTFRLRVDPPVPGKPAGLEALPGNMQATLRWLDPGDTTITGYEVRYEGNGRRQDWRRIPGSDASTVSHRISGLTNGVAYAFRLRATSAAGKGLPSDPVRATPEAPKAEARVVKHALANLAGVLAESSTQAIKRRFQGGLLPSQFTFGGYRLFDRGFDPQTQAGAPWEAYLPAGTWKEQFSGPFDPALEPWLQARHRLGMDARTLLGSSSFMLTGTRKPGETSSDGARRFWSLWGLGVITDVSGSPMDGSFQGQVRTGYLGFDVQTGRRWLLGAALAHSQGRLDYRFDEQEGVLETALTILYPYLHLTLPRGSDLWAILGIGQGRVSNQGSSSGHQRVTNDLSLWSLALGGARPLGRVGGLSLTLQGDAGATSLKTGHDPFNSPINDVRTRTWHLRGGLEATTRLRPLGWLSLEPFLNVSLRQDGGDGLQGGGLEIGGGFRTSALEDRLRVEAHARWLALHAASGASQWEAGLLVQLAPGNDGKGLFLSLRPGYGPDSFPGTGMNLSTGSGMNPGGGHEGNFSASLGSGSNPYLEQASRNALQLDAEIGWGFGRLLNALPGRLRLFAQTRLSEEDPFRLRGGLAYSTEQANSMNLEVFGEHEDGREPTPPDSRVGLQMNVRY